MLAPNVNGIEFNMDPYPVTPTHVARSGGAAFTAHLCEDAIFEPGTWRIVLDKGGHICRYGAFECACR